jgi:N-acetylglutamate synthase-like GNAT family acetyltransferase
MQGTKIRHAENNDLLWLKEHDKHITEKVLQDKIENKEVYVAEKSSKIIGWLRYNLFWDNVPFMSMIDLLDEYRKKGIGTKLVTHLTQTQDFASFSTAPEMQP